jgi:hypothetical protein
MKKILNVIHIPKCGGLIIDILAKELEDKGIKTYTAKNIINFTAVEDYSLISWHFGITFIDNPNVENAVILRDPLDRAISNFLWMEKINTIQRSPNGNFYQDYTVSLLDKLKFYLFKDEFYLPHKNVQTKFLCNKTTDYAMEHYYIKTESGELPKLEEEELMSNVNRTQTWYIEDTLMSLDIAKNNIDKCSIVFTVENHGLFIEKIIYWIVKNLKIDLSKEFKKSLEDLGVGTENIPYYNYSSRYDPATGSNHTTQSLKALLTEKEIAQVYLDNALDLELYNYAKAKLQ